MKFGTLYSYWNTSWECNDEEYVDIIEAVSKIGFDILEISADHVYKMSTEQLAIINEAAKKHNITLTVNSGPPREFDLASDKAEIRKAGIEYFKSILNKMTIIDSKALIGAIYSYWPSDFSITDKDSAWKNSIESLKEIAVVAEELDILISLEVLNRNETYILTDCKEAIEYCELVGSKAVKVLLDTYHMNIEEDNILDAIRLAGDYLGHLHVGECNRKLPGMNNSIDWEGIGATLREIGYDKPIVMEPFLLNGGSVGDSIRVWRDLSNGADKEMMDQYIIDSLAFLKETFVR